VFILQTYAKSIQFFHKHTKLIENRFSRSEVRLECGNFSQGSGTPGTDRVIVFSQLVVKGLIPLSQSVVLSKACNYREKEHINETSKAYIEFGRVVKLSPLIY
jgi:hypothetical protein